MEAWRVSGSENDLLRRSSVLATPMSTYKNRMSRGSRWFPNAQRFAFNYLGCPLSRSAALFSCSIGHCNPAKPCCQNGGRARVDVVVSAWHASCPGVGIFISPIVTYVHIGGTRSWPQVQRRLRSLVSVPLFLSVWDDAATFRLAFFWQRARVALFEFWFEDA